MTSAGAQTAGNGRSGQPIGTPAEPASWTIRPSPNCRNAPPWP